MRVVHAELRKLLGLPPAWGALALGLVVAPVIAYLNRHVSSVDAGYQEFAFGMIGVIVLGVVAVSSEYRAESAEDAGTRQIVTSLTAVPSRVQLLAAKAGALTLTVTVLAAVTAAVTLTVADAEITAARVLGAIIYWVLTALLATGITLLTRSGVVPLVVLILNTTVVSVTYLISKVLSAAGYFPDLAGSRMFIRGGHVDLGIAPATGGLIMCGWTAVVVTAGAVAFCRRDA